LDQTLCREHDLAHSRHTNVDQTLPGPRFSPSGIVFLARHDQHPKMEHSALRGMMLRVNPRYARMQPNRGKPLVATAIIESALNADKDRVVIWHRLGI